MNIKIFTLIIITAFSLLTSNAFSQCDPMTPEQCPDPENNGQVCPDSLAPAFIHQYYSQVATIKPPVVYYLPPDSTVINLDHVKLLEVGNLPDGINWQSNTTDSVFMAGNYYCILMEGQTDSAGLYPLRITVDVFVLVFGVPVRVATVTDSTSLSVLVVDDTGIGNEQNSSVITLQNVPNPFQSITTVNYYSDKAGAVSFEVYNLQGNLIYAENLIALNGNNSLVYNGRMLAPGMYFYRLISSGYQASGIMVKADQ